MNAETGKAKGAKKEQCDLALMPRMRHAGRVEYGMPRVSRSDAGKQPQEGKREVDRSFHDERWGGSSGRKKGGAQSQ